LSILSLCHTVITEKVEDKINYNASSPDELALVSFANEIGGFCFLGKNDENIMTIRVETTGEVLSYKLL
jgi:magnesium-transporting ATPase (P-type)